MKTEPTSILAFRNGSIGNTLVAVPALRALRKRYPEVQLSVVVDPLGFELLEHCLWIDDLIVYDKRGRDRGWAAHLRLIRRLRRLEPSHAVLFKRFFRNGLLAYLSGARVRAGFRSAGHSPFLNVTIPYDETVNIVDLNLRLAALLDATSEDRTLEMYLSNEDREQASTFLRKTIGSGTPYVTAYFGGQTVLPDFLPLPAFVQLIRAVTEDRYPVLIIGAGAYETRLACEMQQNLPASFVATEFPLRVSAAVIEGAQIFIGLSSGPAHLAAAVKTPALVVLRPDATTYSEQAKWLPVGDEIIPMRVPDGLGGPSELSAMAEVQYARRLLFDKMKAPVP